MRLELTTDEVRQVCALYPQSGEAADWRIARAPEAKTLPGRAGWARLLPFAWSRRRTLARSCLAALAPGLLFLWLATPTFRVTASVLVERREATLGIGNRAGESAAFLAGQAEILAGAPILRDALRSSGLADPGRDAVASATRAFSARPVLGTEVIELEYRTQDAAGGERFVQAVIDGYGELAAELGSARGAVLVRTLAAPTRQPTPAWPRPLPVLFACLVAGLLAGLGLAARTPRAGMPAPQGWTALREVAWAG